MFSDKNIKDIQNHLLQFIFATDTILFVPYIWEFWFWAFANVYRIYFLFFLMFDTFKCLFRAFDFWNKNTSEVHLHFSIFTERKHLRFLTVYLVLILDLDSCYKTKSRSSFKISKCSHENSSDWTDHVIFLLKSLSCSYCWHEEEKRNSVHGKSWKK